MKISYNSNNSGGSWWLKDADWIALEKAGWVVEWGGNYYCNSKWDKVPVGKQPCGAADCQGHRKFESAETVTERFLGALASHATRDGLSVGDTLREFERVTGQSVTDEGRNCCGCPHSFSWEGSGYASGEDCLPYLFPNKEIPKTLREAVEKK